MGYGAVCRVPAAAGPEEHAVEHERRRLFPAADPLLRSDDGQSLAVVLEAAVLFAQTVDPLVRRVRVSHEDLVYLHVPPATPGRPLDTRDLILPTKLERKSSIGLRREGQRVPRLDLRRGFELLSLVGEVVPRGAHVPQVSEPPVEPRVLLDQHAADDHRRGVVVVLELDGIQRLHRGLQATADVHAVVPGHELMHPHGPVRGGQEGKPGDGGPRDVRAVVFALASSVMQDLMW